MNIQLIFTLYNPIKINVKWYNLILDKYLIMILMSHA